MIDTEDRWVVSVWFATGYGYTFVGWRGTADAAETLARRYTADARGVQITRPDCSVWQIAGRA